MKRLLLTVTVLVAVLLVFDSTIAQEKSDYDMGKMQMVFLSLSPSWKPRNPQQEKQLVEEQRRHVDALILSGKCAIAGPVSGEGQLREVLVFKTESAEAVQEALKSFPAVKAGMMTSEVLAWYAARNYILAPKTPLKRAKYVFGILVRGAQWAPKETEESKKIQEGHLANINRLAELGKLVLAGPFYNGDYRRGIFIFKVSSLNEAQTLTNTDPAVVAGRLKIQLFQWSVPEGTLK